jgi:hypothetical protein
MTDHETYKAKLRTMRHQMRHGALFFAVCLFSNYAICRALSDLAARRWAVKKGLFFRSFFSVCLYIYSFLFGKKRKKQ